MCLQKLPIFAPTAIHFDKESELYYLQSRYYSPELGRFLNADAFTSTGQGLLGNNMFAYCQNNPVMFNDPNGQCREVGALLTWIDCKSPYCATSSRNQPTRYASNKTKLALVSSNGVYGSINVGAFNITGCVTLAIDTKGNMQIQGSVGFDVTSSGNFSGSVGMINNYMFAPDISSLLGDAYNAGGGGSVLLHDMPYLLSKSGSFFQSGDGYCGVSHTSGITKYFNGNTLTDKPIDFEAHGGYSYTWGLTPSINVFELLGVSFS